MLLSSLEQEGLKTCCASKAGSEVKSAFTQLWGWRKKQNQKQNTRFNPTDAVPLPFAKLPKSRKFYLGTSYQHFVLWKYPIATKTRRKTHMKKTALDLLCLFQIWFGFLTIFQTLLSHPIQAYSKATQCTVYILRINITGILHYGGRTLQKCLISHL